MVFAYIGLRNIDAAWDAAPVPKKKREDRKRAFSQPLHCLVVLSTPETLMYALWTQITRVWFKVVTLV